VQDKLREEFSAFGDEINYEKLMDLPYLDQVMYESLRMHPPLTFGTRECSESVELEVTKDHKVLIEKGLNVIIPIVSVQRDADNFHEPDEFNPERFDESNGGMKAFREDLSLIPFGDGPRMCLGNAFRLLHTHCTFTEFLSSHDRHEICATATEGCDF